MHDELSLKETQKEWHGTYTSYCIGFFASLALTGTSFLLVVTDVLSGSVLNITIAALALMQAVFQLMFFLHLGQEEKPRWETIIFSFMLLLLLIIVIGSLWIMYDLDQRVMSGMKM